MFSRISIIVSKVNYQAIITKLKLRTFSKGSIALKRFYSIAVPKFDLDLTPFSNIFKYYKVLSKARKG